MLNSKAFNILISVITAVILWSYVIYTTDAVGSEVLVNVPVNTVNEDVLNDRGLAIAEEEEITADIKVKGKRTALSELEERDIVLTADVAECVAGDNTVTVNAEMPDSVSLAGRSALTVHINVEEMVTETRKVEVEYSGSSKELDYRLVSPGTVRISGAASTVDAVDHVAAFISDEDIPEADEEVTVALVPVTASGEEVRRIQLSESRGIVRIFSTGTKTVPLEVNISGTPAEGYVYQGIEAPAEIIIKGNETDLAGVASVKCRTVDISRKDGDFEVTLEPVLPDGIAVAEGQALEASVHIGRAEQGAGSVTMSVDDIEIMDLAEGLSAEIEKENIEVYGQGKFTAEDVHLSISLRGYEEGFYVVPLDVETDRDMKVVLSVEKVSVNISKENE